MEKCHIRFAILYANLYRKRGNKNVYFNEKRKYTNQKNNLLSGLASSWGFFFLFLSPRSIIDAFQESKFPRLTKLYVTPTSFHSSNYFYFILSIVSVMRNKTSWTFRFQKEKKRSQSARRHSFKNTDARCEYSSSFNAKSSAER